MRLFEVPPISDEPYEDLPEQVAYFQARSGTAGADFKLRAKEWIKKAGGAIEEESLRVGGHLVDALVKGNNGARYLLLARGTPDAGPRAGLRRTDTVLKAGCLAVLISRRTDLPIILVTSHLPAFSSRSGQVLADLQEDIFDVLAVEGDLRGFQRLWRYLNETPPPTTPLVAPWRGHTQPSLFDRDSTDA